MTLPPMARFLPELMRLKPMATCIFGGTILANYFRLVRPLSMLGGAACLVPAQVYPGGDPGSSMCEAPLGLVPIHMVMSNSANHAF